MPMLAVALAALAVLSTGIVLDILLFVRWRTCRAQDTEHVRVLRERPWTALDAGIIVFVLGVLYTGLVAIFFALEHISGFQVEEHLQLAALLQTLCFHLPAALFVALLVHRRALTWTRAFGIRRDRLAHHTAQGILFYIAALPLTAAAGFAAQALLEGLNFNPMPQHAVSLFTRTGPWPAKVALAGMAIFVAPLAEELIFRGMLLPVAARWMPVPVAVLLVSAAFAAIHMHTPSFLPLLVIATAFSMAYLNTRSLAVPIAMHVTFNAASLGAVALSILMQ